MFSLERVLRRRMLFNAEGGRSETFDRVTRGAFSGIGPRFELATMGVLVTVRALCVRDRRLEVAFGVAIVAGNSLVLAEKWIACFGVVEAFESLDLLPIRSRVAGLARRREAALVRVRVAGRAFPEGKVDIFDVGFRIRQRGMALLAENFLVRTGQRVLGRRVSKARGGLPALESVAARAIDTELPAVFVAVATGAVAGQTEIRAIQILDEDAGACRLRNVIDFVALLAGHGGMAAFERVARLAMIESFAPRFPVNESKVGSVVFGVAARAILAGRVRSSENMVHPAALRQTLADFRMAFETLELCRSAAQVVTLRAVRRTGKRLMGFRKRPGRNLCADSSFAQPAEQEKNSGEK